MAVMVDWETYDATRRAYFALLTAAERTVERWGEFLAAEDTNVAELAERHGLDAAGVAEAVALLRQATADRPAVRGDE